jgi:hypothetical protein
MQITGKLLLNSAEGILKDRKQEQTEIKDTKASQNALKSTARSSLKQTTVESRLLDLQSVISELQKSYSREHARMSYLKESPSEINGDLKFDGKPLFPEFGSDFNPEKTALRVTDQMKHLMQSMRKIQVEMENIHALKFASSEPSDLNTAFQVNSDALKELNPERVARLTR